MLRVALPMGVIGNALAHRREARQRIETSTGAPVTPLSSTPETSLRKITKTHGEGPVKDECGDVERLKRNFKPAKRRRSVMPTVMVCGGRGMIRQIIMHHMRGHCQPMRGRDAIGDERSHDRHAMHGGSHYPGPIALGPHGRSWKCRATNHIIDEILMICWTETRDAKGVTCAYR